MPKELGVAATVPLEDEQVLALAPGQPGAAGGERLSFDEHVAGGTEFDARALPAGHRRRLPDAEHVAVDRHRTLGQTSGRMRIERVATPDDRAPDRLDPLVKLHRPPVEIPPQPPLEIDAEIGELTGTVGRCHRLGSHAASLGPRGQRHLRRLARPGARQPSRTRAGHVAAGPVDHQIANEQLLCRTVTGLIDRLALNFHAGPAGDLRHLRLLAAALRFVDSKLERPVEDHVERAGPEIGRAPLGDDGVDEAGLRAIEVESALPAHVEGARRAGGGR